MRQSICPDPSGLGSPTAGQPASRPLSRRVSKARWEKHLQVVAESRRLAPEWTSFTVALVGVLAGYMSATGGDCFPGLKTLARRLRGKPQTVAKHLNLLWAGGFLEVNRGGGRGRRTGYYATLPATSADQLVKRPARARAQHAPAARRQLEVVAEPAGGEDLPTPAATAAEPAAAQLGDATSEHASAAGAGDVDLVVSEDLGEASAPTPAASGDGQGLVRKTYPLERSGGVGVSSTPSCPPPHPGGHAAQPGGTRHAPRPTRPARVPEPVARVIAALPITEQQRLWARTWTPAVEAIAAGLASSAATPAELAREIGRAAPWPLRDARSPGGVVVARMPAALELLAKRRAADAHACELGAAPSAAAASSVPPGLSAAARAKLAEAKAAIKAPWDRPAAEIAAAPDPKAPPPGGSSLLVSAPWDRVSGRPGRVPLPELLARLESRGGGAGEDGPAAGLGA